MANQSIPKLFFVGAGNIAQSVMKGILKAHPDAAAQMLATAPTSRNLDIIQKELRCQVCLLSNARGKLSEFNPDFVFICVKPQVLMTSITKRDLLLQLLSSVPHRCVALSLLPGIKSQMLAATLNQPERNTVRLMFNTAAQLGASSVFYYPHHELDPSTENKMQALFKLIGSPIVRLTDESLMDVATGVCGSGMAFIFEVIQAISDIFVKNGFTRVQSTELATHLFRGASKMLLNNDLHPYEMRDKMTEPSGPVMFGIDKWQELSINHKIGQAIQSSIDRAKSLSIISENQLEERLNKMM